MIIDRLMIFMIGMIMYEFFFFWCFKDFGGDIDDHYLGDKVGDKVSDKVNEE